MLFRHVGRKAGNRSGMLEQSLRQGWFPFRIDDYFHTGPIGPRRGLIEHNNSVIQSSLKRHGSPLLVMFPSFQHVRTAQRIS